MPGNTGFRWKQAAFLWSLSSKKKNAAGDLLITNAVYISSCVKPEVYQFHWNILSNFANRFFPRFSFCFIPPELQQVRNFVIYDKSEFQKCNKTNLKILNGISTLHNFYLDKTTKRNWECGWRGRGVKKWWRRRWRAGKVA